MIEIVSNGAKWAGQEPDNLEMFMEKLEKYTLDPCHARNGHYINTNPIWITNEDNEKYKGCVAIRGNFYDISSVFNIITDEEEVIKNLRALIDANMNTEAYWDAKKSYAKRAYA